MAARVERRMLVSVPWGLVGATVLTATIGIYNLVSASRHITFWLHYKSV